MPLFKRYRRKHSLILFLFMAVSIYGSLYSFYYLETNLRPNLISIAEVRTKKIATEAINDAVSKKIAEETDYRNLLDIKLDSQGRVSYAQLNFSEVSRIAAETTIRVQNTLNAIEKEVIRIPIGQAFNSTILSQYGPTIPITIVPQGAAYTNVDWRFEEAGINQTLHVVFVEVKADVKIVIPFDTKNTQVVTRIPIAYALYVGNVPQFYYNGRGLPQGTEGGGDSPSVKPPNIFPPIQIMGN
ncbi:sporulation protein YunB [Desulfuribacillus stibiiarsenatis]|uniref:Sporulation protein YunB n=1 Tax=Desulfuribacillus stibiiarsenatis TaxID=1390249 RepID=A0A1E5L2N4_9FIRM|nr:sporulation protein YunB [Desulfuribacillus stibiiarsenatis]OEH84422.1 sporulation protein YunB [Desulfuribacillus stibiiarsenatis]